jgi:enamine deaminase RidA (YjgF/YER057c/UK114 family)
MPLGPDKESDQVTRIMTERYRRYLPDRSPIWTCMGAAALGDPQVRVEIRVTAMVPE